MRPARVGTFVCGLLAAYGMSAATADGHEGREQLAGELARCAAYYFNATKARPIADYEALYSAGERAFNRAARLIDRETLDRLVAETAIEMTATIGGDWRNFGRVEARYAAPCSDLERPGDR